MSREVATNTNCERGKLRWQFCAAFLLSVAASVAFGQSSPCHANFNVGGSVVRGTTYTSVDEYRGAYKPSVMAALTQALTEQSFTFTEPDKTADSFVATGTIGGREAQEVTFTVTPFPGGTRLSFHHRLGIGTRGRDETVQQDLCQILGKITPILRERVLSAVTRSDATDSGAKLSIGAEAAQGRYLRRGHPADYLELRAGSFKAQQSGRPLFGTYEIRGDKLILTTALMAVPAVGRFLSKDKIRDPDGFDWEREQVLTNDDVVNLAKAGLDDEIVIAKVKNAPAAQLDVSTDALVALKKAKVSSAVIAAMVERASRPAPTASAGGGTDSADAATPRAAPPAPKSPPNPCADIELMGLQKEDMRPVSPLIVYLAQVRNSSNVTRIVRLQWLDMYGQPMQATLQVGGGQIARAQLAAQEPFQRQPIELRVASCQ
jgi:hypothetical protein